MVLTEQKRKSLEKISDKNGGNARTGQKPRRGHALQVHLWHHRHHPADAELSQLWHLTNVVL